MFLVTSSIIFWRSLTRTFLPPSSVLTNYPVYYSNFASRNKLGRPKITTNKNKRVTKICISDANNEITAIENKKQNRTWW